MAVNKMLDGALVCISSRAGMLSAFPTFVPIFLSLNRLKFTGFSSQLQVGANRVSHFLGCIFACSVAFHGILIYLNLTFMNLNYRTVSFDVQ